MKASIRSLIGMVASCAWLFFYVIVAVQFGSSIIEWPRLVQLVYYVVAGVIWVVPLYPLMKWVSRGHNQN